MTDNEMLCKILESVNNLESDMKAANNRLDKIDSEVSSLRAGQIEIRKEIKQVDKRVSDTYNLALDAWGTSAENRKWLETANG